MTSFVVLYFDMLEVTRIAAISPSVITTQFIHLIRLPFADETAYRELILKQWRDGQRSPPTSKAHRVLLRQNANNQGIADRIRRACRLLMTRGSDLKCIKPTGGGADSIQVIVTVPLYLKNIVSSQQSCVRSNRIAAVEVKHLQSTRSG